MLYSVVDDRSGVVYQEYRCVYGEDAKSALRFLFNAIAPKAEDNGTVTKSRVFQNVMDCLGVGVLPHMPADKATPDAPGR